MVWGRRATRRLAVALLAILLGTVPSVMTPPPAFATSFTVDDQRDDPDANPGDGTCRTAQQACTLRAAIQEANARPGHDLIAFRLVTVVLPGQPHPPMTIVPRSALPVVTDSVTIDGATMPGYAGDPLVELDGRNAGSGVHGLEVRAKESLVRGLAINFFGGYGVVIRDGGRSTVQGNYIGVDPAGQFGRRNSSGGLLILNSSDNLIGGQRADPRQRNVISGNLHAGVLVHATNFNAQNNRIEGNLIGTDPSASRPLPQNEGIWVVGGVGTRIGGSSPALGNVIAGNFGSGIRISSASLNGTSIANNFIGTDPSGTRQLGNGVNSGDGVTISSGSDNTIGPGNLIAFNRGAGVRVRTPQPGSQTTHNGIHANSIHSNGGLGIELEPVGPTPNDQGDGDGGANRLQNFPVISSARFVTNVGRRTQIDGTLQSLSNLSFRIDFYAAPECDASGHGEGKTYLGSTNVGTDGSGNARFAVSMPPVGPPQSITATATLLIDRFQETSEFSACRPIVNGG